MFYLLRELFSGGNHVNNEGGGVTGLLKDGTFMMWAAVGTTVAFFVTLIVLATGAVAEVFLMWQVRDQLNDAYTGDFLRFLVLWREFKPVILLLILVGGVALSVYFLAGGWSKRKPNPIIMATGPQSNLGASSVDEVEYDLDAPQYEEQVRLSSEDDNRQLTG